MNLELRSNLTTNPMVRFGLRNGSVYQRSVGNGLDLAQEFHNSFKIYDLATGGVVGSGGQPEGFINISDGSRGVTAMIRNFWQMWPTGLEVDGQNKLSLQLFPR
jgi:hypothetical protein